MVLPSKDASTAIKTNTGNAGAALQPADDIAENSSKSNQSEERLRVATEQMFGSRTPITSEKGEETPERIPDGNYHYLNLYKPAYDSNYFNV